MKQTITINWAWVGVYALLLAILGTSIFSVTSRGEARSITVEGTATIDAEPDSFVFNPQFEVDTSDPARVKTLLADKGNAVVAKLKELGVKDQDIKLDASQYDAYPMLTRPESGKTMASVNLTVTVRTKALAQKVQDYLDTTDAKGQLTPQPTFSEQQRQQLTKAAEAKAIADARLKADALARNLEAKRGKVITVTNLSDQRMIGYGEIQTTDVASSRASLPVQPGTNQFTYRVSVKYALR